MTTHCYRPQRRPPKTQRLVDQIVEITDEYMEQGWRLTVRQLYYQFVARGLLPNCVKSYRDVQKMAGSGRLSGDIDWDAIEDRSRNIHFFTKLDSPAAALKKAADRYAIDMWRDQPSYVECWIEKEALVGVIEPACGDWRVPFYGCHGYDSLSQQHEAAERFKDQNNENIVVLYLGDHDPSGMDMTRNHEERLEQFADDLNIEVRRIALNMDQVRRYNPPPNPAKHTDSRHSDYVRLYGNKSWELDALSPEVIDGIVRHAIEGLVDHDQWAKDQRREQREQAEIMRMAKSGPRTRKRK